MQRLTHHVLDMVIRTTNRRRISTEYRGFIEFPDPDQELIMPITKTGKNALNTVRYMYITLATLYFSQF